MFEGQIEKTVIISVIFLWFAHGWYLNERLKHIHKKLDLIMNEFGGLRDYLYEIDSQFDDERRLIEELDGNSLSAGRSLFELEKKKTEMGRRTLKSGFQEY